MSTETRAQLAAAQAELVTALVETGTPPAGFDPNRFHAAASSLSAKRLRSVARVWPDLASGLEDRFAERFRAFAMTTPVPRVGGPVADGRAFLRSLGKDEQPPACRLQALLVDACYVETADGLAPRRWPTLKVALLPNPRRLIVALRLPWFGVMMIPIRVSIIACECRLLR